MFTSLNQKRKRISTKLSVGVFHDIVMANLGGGNFPDLRVKGRVKVLLPCSHSATPLTMYQLQKGPLCC